MSPLVYRGGAHTARRLSFSHEYISVSRLYQTHSNHAASARSLGAKLLFAFSLVLAVTVACALDDELDFLHESIPSQAHQRYTVFYLYSGRCLRWYNAPQCIYGGPGRI